MDLKLRDRRVLITGASQGIGAALAEAFAEEGARLKLVARHAANLEAVADAARRGGATGVATLALDITQPGAVESLVEFAGDTEILVNNAGAIPGGNLWDVDAAAWRRGWELKVLGYIDLTRAFYPLMKARGGGVILNNIGNGGENVDFDYIAGSTGNASLMAFTRALGGRSLDDGIRVVGINPGPVATDRIVKVLKKRAIARFGNEDQHDQLLKQMPLGRAATPREVADLMVFLASPRSAYTSGTIVTIDGGLASRRSIG